MFNLCDTPFAESPSFVNEEDARNNPTMARGLAVSRNWGEGANQGQGGLTLQHRFSEAQLMRVTGWGMWRDLDAPGVFRMVELGRTGFGSVRWESSWRPALMCLLRMIIARSLAK